MITVNKCYVDKVYKIQVLQQQYICFDEALYFTSLVTPGLVHFSKAPTYLYSKQIAENKK